MPAKWGEVRTPQMRQEPPCKRKRRKPYKRIPAWATGNPLPPQALLRRGGCQLDPVYSRFKAGDDLVWFQFFWQLGLGEFKLRPQADCARHLAVVALRPHLQCVVRVFMPRACKLIPSNGFPSLPFNKLKNSSALLFAHS